ncbi:MAG: hypothetical protein H7287_08980 [Thermoleophilia bacterium]|nr:hypothetical protein [Thermoleophilia bacterium]
MTILSLRLILPVVLVVAALVAPSIAAAAPTRVGPFCVSARVDVERCQCCGRP